MARKGSTIPQEELYSPDEEFSREDDARLLDLDVEKEVPFLRAQKRVSVRRGTLPKKTATRLFWAAAALSVLLLCALAVDALYHYGQHDWRFRIASSDDIAISGLQNVTRAQVMDVMGGDIGRNIFFVPLSQRKAQLEQIPWVQSASVMRFVPNRLRIEIHERTPIAFARVGSKIMLTDASGTLMDLPQHKSYSFPVIVGMGANEPSSTREARMALYDDLISQLDAGGARYSQELSEVDLNDPEDVKVLASGPDGEVLIHLGSSDYLARYKTYVSHVQEWRQQFSKIDSVDLRYDRQIVVNPDMGGIKTPPPLSANAAKAAMAAGVKRAALVNYEHIAAKASAEAAVRIDPLRKPSPVKKDDVKHVPAHTVARSTAKLTARKTAVKKAAPRNQYGVARKAASHPASRPLVRASSTHVIHSSASSASKYKKPSPSIPKDHGAHQ